MDKKINIHYVMKWLVLWIKWSEGWEAAEVEEMLFNTVGGWQEHCKSMQIAHYPLFCIECSSFKLISYNSALYILAINKTIWHQLVAGRRQ